MHEETESEFRGTALRGLFLVGIAGTAVCVALVIGQSAWQWAVGIVLGIIVGRMIE